MKVWKTEIILNRHARQLPFDSARLHRILTVNTGTPNTLWSSPRAGIILVQSDRPVRPEGFQRDASSIRSKEIDLRFEQDSRVEMAGIINATRVHTTPAKKSRVPLSADEIPGWLTRQLANAATLDTITVEQLSPAKGRRDTGPMIHSRAGFHAYATITDTARFEEILHQGIGRGKRFGCGMITARRIP